MDQTRLDHLTRFFAQRTGRRALATGTLGGLLGTLVPGFGTIDAGARKKRRSAKQLRCKKPKRNCGKKCVNVKTDRLHCGQCNRRCKKGHTCRKGKCVPPPTCGNGGSCLVFATSVMYQGNLGGLDGGDAKCNQLAQAAGLPGTYRAWLAHVSGSPSTRFTKNSGPYVLPNGTRVANSWNDLTDGELLAPINQTENGGSPSSSLVWTGAQTNGLWQGYDCTNWTSNSVDAQGSRGRSDLRQGWTSTGESTCNSSLALYCFQQT